MSSFQQFTPFFNRWHMTQASTVDEQVIDIMHQRGAYNLEEVMRFCTNLTWNQVFLAVDR